MGLAFGPGGHDPQTPSKQASKQEREGGGRIERESENFPGPQHRRKKEQLILLASKRTAHGRVLST